MTQMLKKADKLRRNGKYEQACELYEQIVVDHPDEPMGWWGLAHVVMNQGDFELAVRHFQRAAKLAPNQQRIIYDWAMLHTMLGEYDAARPLFEKVVGIDPNSKEGADAQKQLTY